jgi:hypothetical protein
MVKLLQAPRVNAGPARTAVMALALLTLGAATCASELATSMPLLPKYRQECGSCHLPYPPGMLPGASWRRLLGHLPQHFGGDASLDDATLRELISWLDAHAATSPKAMREPPQDRITRSDWFLREHDELAPAVWKRPAIKSPSNCTACHTQADQGDFNEHRVHIPR